MSLRPLSQRPARALTARTLASAATAVTALAVWTACADTTTAPTGAALARDAAPGVHRQYGVPVSLGNGRARTYAIVDQKAGGRTLELGVALDERAMEGLRAPDPSHGEHDDHDMLLLPLPTQQASAFKFVELDWNPRGHGFPYTEPHFDFHFYTISQAERAAIVPSDPAWAAKARNEPAAASVPAYYANPATILGLPPEALAVPQMGMHWLDLRSPEVQPPGSPTHRPFTTTFIYGAWDGQLIFMEPMITRAFIMAKRDATDPAVRDEVIPISTSSSYPSGGFRPNAYRVAYDAQAKEYRIALTMQTAQH
ncbi:MAG TPA: DUF5602 domain-containing protein [Gemmatirosa sp.]|nr:DUF5602 domain-containing protein [Gemmatirosa sp.]